MKNPAFWQEMGHCNTRLGGNQAKCEKVLTLFLFLSRNLQTR